MWGLFVGFGLHHWLVQCLGIDYIWAAVLLWVIPTIAAILVMVFYMVPALNKAFAPEESVESHTPAPTDIDKEFMMTDMTMSLHDFSALFSIGLLGTASYIAWKPVKH